MHRASSCSARCSTCSTATSPPASWTRWWAPSRTGSRSRSRTRCRADLYLRHLGQVRPLQAGGAQARGAGPGQRGRRGRVRAGGPAPEQEAQQGRAGGPGRATGWREAPSGIRRAGTRAGTAASASTTSTPMSCSTRCPTISCRTAIRGARCGASSSAARRTRTGPTCPASGSAEPAAPAAPAAARPLRSLLGARRHQAEARQHHEDRARGHRAAGGRREGAGREGRGARIVPSRAWSRRPPSTGRPLDELPESPAGRIQGLQNYEFMDPDAHRMFWELMKGLQQQMLQPFLSEHAEGSSAT